MVTLLVLKLITKARPLLGGGLFFYLRSLREGTGCTGAKPLRGEDEASPFVKGG